MSKKMSLGSILTLSVGAALKRAFGGIPLERLTLTAKRQHRKNFTVKHSQQTHARAKAGQQECLRRLAFKDRHGHFA